MAFRKYQNLEIDFWVNRSKLGVDQLTLCLSHDSVNDGVEFLDLLSELRDAQLPAQRVMTFRACGYGSPLRKLTMLRVIEREDLKVLSLRREQDVATFEMTDLGLTLLVDGFQAWLKGAEDFGISPGHSALRPKQLGQLDRESAELWFWGPTMLP